MSCKHSSFLDLYTGIKYQHVQIHEEQVGEDIQIAEADVNAVIKSLKLEKHLVRMISDLKC